MNKLTAEVARQDLNRMRGWVETCGLSMKEERYLQALEIALPILEQQEQEQEQEQEQKGDGWIEWGGGKRPVDSDCVVGIRYRDGEEDAGVAGYQSWIHHSEEDDIIAYRIIPKQPDNHNGDQ